MAQRKRGSPLPKLIEPLWEQRLVGLGERTNMINTLTVIGTLGGQQHWIQLHIPVLVGGDR